MTALPECNAYTLRTEYKSIITVMDMYSGVRVRVQRCFFRMYNGAAQKTNNSRLNNENAHCIRCGEAQHWYMYTCLQRAVATAHNFWYYFGPPVTLLCSMEMQSTCRAAHAMRFWRHVTPSFSIQVMCAFFGKCFANELHLEVWQSTECVGELENSYVST